MLNIAAATAVKIIFLVISFSLSEVDGLVPMTVLATRLLNLLPIHSWASVSATRQPWNPSARLSWVIGESKYQCLSVPSFGMFEIAVGIFKS